MLENRTSITFTIVTALVACLLGAAPAFGQSIEGNALADLSDAQRKQVNKIIDRADRGEFPSSKLLETLKSHGLEEDVAQMIVDRAQKVHQRRKSNDKSSGADIDRDDLEGDDSDDSGARDIEFEDSDGDDADEGDDSDDDDVKVNRAESGDESSDDEGGPKELNFEDD
jgi:hypothetical protein